MRLNKNKLPEYLDGKFTLYRIVQSDGLKYTESLVEYPNESVWFENRGITDRLRSELNASKTNPELKIRIPQNRKIDNMCVLEIDDKYYRVYNAYHFTNNDGFLQSDLTLTEYHVYKEGE